MLLYTGGHSCLRQCSNPALGMAAGSDTDSETLSPTCSPPNNDPSNYMLERYTSGSGNKDRKSVV